MRNYHFESMSYVKPPWRSKWHCTAKTLHQYHLEDPSHQLSFNKLWYLSGCSISVTSLDTLLLLLYLGWWDANTKKRQLRRFRSDNHWLPCHPGRHRCSHQQFWRLCQQKSQNINPSLFWFLQRKYLSKKCSLFYLLPTVLKIDRFRLFSLRTRSGLPLHLPYERSMGCLHCRSWRMGTWRSHRHLNGRDRGNDQSGAQGSERKT